MKAAVIGAGQESLHSVEAAKRKGIRTVALDGDPGAAGLSAADRGIVTDISDENAVLAALAADADESGEPVDFVITAPIGRYLTTIGFVNDALGLPGISRSAAMKCTDKWLFHQSLQEAGLRDSWCVPLGKEAGSCFIPSYPAIIKPRFGSGSRGIFYLENEKQLEAALSAIRERREAGQTEEYVIEEAAGGVEYGADGAVTGTDFSLILLRKKLLTPLPARQATGYLSVSQEKEPLLWQAAQARLFAAVRALGLRDCLLHADLMIDTQDGADPGNCFVIELSARPSGHYLHDRFVPMATGVDMAAAFLDYQCALVRGFGGRAGQSLIPRAVRPMLIRYFDFEDCVILSVPDPHRLALPRDIRLREWRCKIKPGDFMGKVTTGHSLMGRGYFILENVSELNAGGVREWPDTDRQTGSDFGDRRLFEAAKGILGCFGTKPWP